MPKTDKIISGDIETTGPSVSGDVAGKFEQIDKIFVAIIAVLVVGFITLLITVCGLAFAYIHDSQDIYKQSRDALNAQNDKIDVLIKEVTK